MPFWFWMFMVTAMVGLVACVVVYRLARRRALKLELQAQRIAYLIHMNDLAIKQIAVNVDAAKRSNGVS